MERIIFIFCGFLIGAINGETTPSVTSKLGLINGISIPVTFNGKDYTVNRYAGLRYAKAPVGDLRFQKPVPYGAFDSPFNASEFTSACQQTLMMPLGVDTLNEDCLSLNVYSPTKGADKAAGYAVMISVHGGGLGSGAATLYAGEVLAAVGNVIVVTINYRLGMLGFANSGDGQIPGNMGFWDQIMAFQWVHDNLDSFGGDKSRVTIFGQSAGALSVMLQSLYPANQGLFHNTIAQSGSATMPFNLSTNNFDNMAYVAKSLDCKTDDIGDVVKCLKNTDISDLMAKLDAIAYDIDLGWKIQFVATMDGDFIKQKYSELVQASREKSSDEMNFFRSLNLINGMNTAEGAMFLMMLGQEDMEQITLSEEDFRSTQLPRMLNYFWNWDEKDLPGELLKLISYHYTDTENLGNFRDSFVQLISDQMFLVPGREWLDVHANVTTSNTYFYSFEAKVEQRAIPTPSWVKGSNHGDELLAVHGYCMATTDTGLCGMINMTDYKPPNWELALSDRMMTYWSNFAKTGNPNGVDQSSLLSWPQMEADDTAYLVFNQEDSVRHDNLYASDVAFWREIAPAIWGALLRSDCHSGKSAYSSGTCDADNNCD